MEKIYSLRADANELMRQFGHDAGYYVREFHRNDTGGVSKVLINQCVRCGMEVVVVDYPFGKEGTRYSKEISGPAVSDFCRYGFVPVEEYKNVFAVDRVEYERKKREKLEKLMRRHKLDFV